MWSLNGAFRWPMLHRVGLSVLGLLSLALSADLAADLLGANLANLRTLESLTARELQSVPGDHIAGLEPYIAGTRPSNSLSELAYLRRLVANGKLSQALDQLEKAEGTVAGAIIHPGQPSDPFRSLGGRCYPYGLGDLDVRVGLCEPVLSLGLRARRLAVKGDWSGAASAYRDLMARAPARAGDEILPEYHLALARMYDLAPPSTDQRWRAVLHYWRAGQPDLAEALAESLSRQSAARSHARFLEGTRLLTGAQRYQGVALLLSIPTNDHSAYLRSRFALLQDEIKRRGSEPSSLSGLEQALQEELRGWVPAIPVGKEVEGVGFLAGLEILDPELLGDGGIVTLLLWWRATEQSEVELVTQGEASNQSRQPDWVALGDGRYVQLVGARNLTPDPGFDWSSGRFLAQTPGFETTLGYWSQAFGWLQPEESWRLAEETRNGESTVVSCLDNQSFGHESGRTGIGTWWVSILPDRLYLQISRVRVEQDRGHRIMGLCWDMGEPRCSSLTLEPIHDDWQDYAQLIQAPSEAAMVSVFVQNKWSSSELCVDSMVLVQLPMPAQD